MTADSVTIEVRGLTKNFGPVQAVRGLDFAVQPGRVTGFLGPNGSGKTTTMRMMLGLVAPTSGTATFNGVRYVDLANPTTVVGAALDSSNFHPSHTARDHLRVYATMGGHGRRRVEEVIEWLGIGDFADRVTAGYSTGMRQRLHLATALLGDPRVLLLDEPSNGLDPQGIAWLREVLRDLAAQDRTVLVSSHVLAEMEHTVDEVVVIRRGELVASGSLDELSTQARDLVIVSSPDADRLYEAIAGLPEAVVSRAASQTLHVEGTTAAAVGDLAAAQALRIHELTTRRSSLEQQFLRLTTDHEGALA